MTDRKQILSIKIQFSKIKLTINYTENVFKNEIFYKHSFELEKKYLY